MCINPNRGGPFYTEHFRIIGQCIWPVKESCKSLPWQIVAHEEYISIGKLFTKSVEWKQGKMTAPVYHEQSLSGP